MVLTRRSVLKSAALAAATTALPTVAGATAPSNAPADQFHGLRVGVCSYSLRSFPLDKMLADVRRLGVQYLSLKDVHLPLTATPAQRQQVRQQAHDLGLTITSCGVIYLKDNPETMRQALEYVRNLGANIAVVGATREQLPTLDKVIRDFDLKAAIHNHGPNDKRFPSPLQVYDAIQPFDKRIGVCMDIGHTFRMHEDVVADVKRTKDRLYSMHFKDLDSDRVDAKGVPVGTGVMPIIALLKELLTSGYSGEVQLEYEVEPEDPVPGMAESLGFMRGSLQTLLWER
ncbi:MAG TPA: sugar phosphate isomerase/epimerase [Terriglobales bacterium]|nr:sugar phosphate isomerase/epimerase [Terriglobales bacterium]